MKRNILTLIISIFIAFLADAQTTNFEKYPKVGTWEFEFSLSNCEYISQHYFQGYRNFEIRKNIQGTPWSYGINFGLLMTEWKEKELYRYFPTINEAGKIENIKTLCKENIDLGGTLYGITGEYDFARGGNINPYIGINGGLCWNDNDRVGQYARASLGVELFSHVRLGVTPMLTSFGGKFIILTIGAVLGGGKRSISSSL